jgi:hypothetical protein
MKPSNSPQSPVSSAPTTGEQPRGLECARCGCRHFIVVWTRQRDREIARGRDCRHCRRRIITRETIVVD